MIFLGQGVISNYLAYASLLEGFRIVQFTNLGTSSGDSWNKFSYEKLSEFIYDPADIVVCSWRKLNPRNARAFEVSLQRSRPNKIIFLSTSAIYGECLNPVNESSIPRPKSGYALDKLEVENFLSSTRILTIVFFRIGSVFGNPRLPGLVDAVVRSWTLSPNSSRLELKASTSFTRNFVFIDDLSESFLGFINSNYFEKIGVSTINIGSRFSIDIGSLFTLGEIAANREILYTPLQPDSEQISSNLIDVGLMTAILGKIAVNPYQSLYKFFSAYDSDRKERDFLP